MLLVYHVEVMLRLDPSLQVPDEDAAVVASGEDDPGVEGMGLQDKHLCLVALQHKTIAPPFTILHSVHLILSQSTMSSAD